MYESFYGLRERPFDLSPNPRFLFLTPGHRRALVNLDLGIASRKGVIALIGEPGTGKTTVARAVMARRESTTFIYLNQSLTSAADLRRSLAHSLHLGPRAEASHVDLILDLTRHLSTLLERGRTVSLIVDEAQGLSDELLEEIRLLTNVESPEGKLLTLVLIGQPRLASRLNEERWAQVKQRIEIRCVLSPLELNETAAYICSRVRTAGGDAAQLFTADAIRLIYERSRGIPRTISVIGENALNAGFAENERPLTRRIVQQVCEELDLLGPATEVPPPAPAPEISQIPLARSVQPPTKPGPAPRRDLPLAQPRPARAKTTGRRWWFWSRAWSRS
jgi:general secretion pathway protein A